MDEHQSIDQEVEQLSTDREVEYLLQLLGEYAEKVHQRSRAYHQLSLRAQRTFLLFAASALVAGMLGLWICLRTLGPDVMTITFVGAGVLTLLLTGLLGGLLMMRRARIESENNHPLLHLLVDVVRRASQMEDHGRMSPTHRLALRLRLADAEAALRELHA